MSLKFMYFIVFAVIGCVMFTGCNNLVDKAFINDSDIYGFKGTAGADPSSGSITPSLAVGSGSNLLITMPTNNDGTLEYEDNSGSFFGDLFGVETKNSVKVKITSGKGSIKVESKVSDNKEVTTEIIKDKAIVTVQDDTVVTIP